uniref:Uncharacterized protein n=1 Tax=Arion vulgaris TaxID=1028688 RepID=A0A0B6ZUG1_9EUPU
MITMPSVLTLRDVNIHPRRVTLLPGQIVIPEKEIYYIQKKLTELQYEMEIRKEEDDIKELMLTQSQERIFNLTKENEQLKQMLSKRNQNRIKKVFMRLSKKLKLRR